MMDDKGNFSEEEALEKAFSDLLKEEDKPQTTKETSKSQPADVSKRETKPQGQTDKVVTVKESDYLSLLKDIADSKDRYLRLFAEFENVQKRTDREKIDFVKYANGELLKEFVAILDDLERSVEAARTKHEDYDAFLKGVEMVMAHVYEMLKKNNVKPIEAKGKVFDPHLHEALMQEDTDKKFKEGEVVEELQKGYMLGEKVIRTAKVKVAKHKE